MLDHHPEIAFEHEFDLAIAMVSDDGSLPTMEPYHRFLQSVRSMNYEINRSLTYRDLLEGFLRQKRARSGKASFVGATIHHEFQKLLFVWPDARFVHLIRDPRDVARSVLEKKWAGNLYQAADWWTKAERSWDTLVAKLTPEQYVEVRYEDLVTNVEGELAKICRFIGVPYDKRMLDYSDDAPQYPKPDPKLALQWKTRMTARDIALVEAKSGCLMADRGYPRTAENLNIGPLLHKRLMLQSRMAQLGYRIQDYGLITVFLDMLGRRMRLQVVADHAKRRINFRDGEAIREESKGFRAPSANIAPLFQQRS
jgi:hypothetical protein